jgi:hypothetical protein
VAFSSEPLGSTSESMTIKTLFFRTDAWFHTYGKRRAPASRTHTGARQHTD